MNPRGNLTEVFLRQLVRTPLQVRALVQGTKKGFQVVAYIGEEEKLLERSRGGPRLFASLDTAAAFVREIGLPRFEVDMTDYQPGRLRKARPDRAEALKRTRTRMKQQSLEV